MNGRFPVVGGHALSILYGETTAEGHTTLQKMTTAWEIIYYLGMHFSEQLLLRLTMGDAFYTPFVRAMKGLKRFASRFFAARLPEAWAPHSDALRREIERLGGMGQINGTWLKASDPAFEELWILLFLELFEESSNLRGWSETYDRPLWGLGLVDETSGAQEPAGMDVKIGILRYSPHTPKEKVARLDLKEEGCICRKVAMRPCGFRRFVHSVPGALDTTTKVEQLGKQFGYRMCEDELRTLLRCFPSTAVSLLEGYPNTSAGCSPHHVRVKDCNDSMTQARRRVMREAVEDLLYFFQETVEGAYLIETMAFVSTSLLFLYDATGGVETGKVCLIDFARSSYRHLNYDERTIGFIKGLQNMVNYLNTPVYPREGLIQVQEKDQLRRDPAES